jgi:hypothetical protein
LSSSVEAASVCREITRKASAQLPGHGIDVSTIAFIALALVLLETQSLRPHALYLFIERIDLVIESIAVHRRHAIYRAPSQRRVR